VSDIFLSYASEDRLRVKPVVDALEARGWSVWWDPTIRPGQIFARVIQEALDKARCVVVLWSRESVESDWVQTEAGEGLKRKILIPALLDVVVIPLEFRRIHAANLVGWSGALPYSGFEELARAVEGLLGLPAAQPAKVSAAAAPSAIIQPAPPPRLTSGQKRKNPKDGLTYVWIPPGKFTMGCSPGDSECSASERPPHEVTITCGFWMGYDEEYYQRSPATDPAGPGSGPYRVLRGGSWGNNSGVARASVRLRGEPTFQVNLYGFRCAGELP
jgi:hypothetical protein